MLKTSRKYLELGCDETLMGSSDRRYDIEISPLHSICYTTNINVLTSAVSFKLHKYYSGHLNTSAEEVSATARYPSKSSSSTQKTEDTKTDNGEKTESARCRVSHRVGEY